MDIFVPSRPRLHFQNTVRPNPGDLVMDCGECGAREFRAFVRPRAHGAGRIVELVCANPACQRIYKLDDAAQLGGQSNQHGKAVKDRGY